MHFRCPRQDTTHSSERLKILQKILKGFVEETVQVLGPVRMDCEYALLYNL